MAMRLFLSNETDFSTNGHKYIESIFTHEIRNNSEWYLDVRVPLEFIEFIEQDNIVVVKTKEKGKQPFRIKDITVGSDIRFEAWHIGFDTKVYTVSLSTVINLNCQNAINEILGDTQSNNFTSFSDISGLQTFSIINMTLYEALIDVANRYNGFLDFDGWQIQIVSSIGQDRGVTIAYGKNLESAEVEERWDMVCTELLPLGNDGLVGSIVYSSIQYDRPYAKIVNFDTDDLTTLNNLASAYVSRFEVPQIHYKVEASVVSSLEDNKGHKKLSQFTHLFLEDYTQLELSNFTTVGLIGLGDIIEVKARQFTIFSNIIGYKYNAKTHKMIELEFGNFRPTVKNAFRQLREEVIQKSRDITQIKIDEVNNEIELKVDKDGVISAINLSEELVKILANKIQLEGLVTANEFFKILLDGSMEAVNGSFSGNVTANSGSIGRFAISGDDLVYTSDLFDKDYDNSDLQKLRRILLGLQPQTAYDLAVYDFNNSGTLTVTDAVILENYTLSGIPLPTPLKRIRSVVRIGTDNGAFTTQAVAENGSLGPVTITRGEKTIVDLLNTNGLYAKTSSIDRLDVDKFYLKEVTSGTFFETGTWTPVLYGKTSAGAGTYTTQTGQYTKIGNVVHIALSLTWTAHSGTGFMAISGLPFTSANLINVLEALPVNLTFSNQFKPVIAGNATIIELYTFVTNAGNGQITMDTTGTLHITGHYFI